MPDYKKEYAVQWNSSDLKATWHVFIVFISKCFRLPASFSLQKFVLLIDII
jgi:hypothetical protein